MTCVFKNVNVINFKYLHIQEYMKIINIKLKYIVFVLIICMVSLIIYSLSGKVVEVNATPITAKTIVLDSGHRPSGFGNSGQ